MTANPVPGLEELFDHGEVRWAGDDTGKIPVVEDQCIPMVGILVYLDDLLPVDNVGFLHPDKIIR